MKLAFEEIGQRSAHEAGRQLLARLYLAETGEALPEIRCTPQGKPYFPGNGLHFSISHTKRMVFCALSRKNIGIDAEEMGREVAPAVINRFLSESERQRQKAAPDPNAAALRLWVLKESWAKFTGRGLGNYLKATDFAPGDPRIREIAGCYVAVMQEDDHGNV